MIEDILQNLSNRIDSFCDSVVSAFNDFGNFLSVLGEVVEVIYYGITSLLSGIWSFIVQVFDGEVFNHVGETFNYVSVLIGGPATVFISSFFLLVVIRICIAFIFKFFRFNIDYNNTPKKI